MVHYRHKDKFYFALFGTSCFVFNSVHCSITGGSDFRNCSWVHVVIYITMRLQKKQRNQQICSIFPISGMKLLQEEIVHLGCCFFFFFFFSITGLMTYCIKIKCPRPNALPFLMAFNWIIACQKHVAVNADKFS